MSVSMSDIAYALQEYYSKSAVENVALRDHPFLGLIKRVPTSGGTHVLIIQTGNGGGRSGRFSDAQSNTNGSKGFKFKIDTVNDYALVQIDTDVIESADGSNAASFLKSQVVEFDAKLAALGNSMAHAVWRSGSGSIGRISASQSASATTLVLADPNDAVFLEVGMKLYADSADGGGTVGTTQTFVKSVDMSAGTFTVSATYGGAAVTATVADLTANQYLFVVGDYDAKAKGVAAWIPATVASNDNFWGVNRSDDRTRLAGHYFDKRNVPVEEAISDVVSEMCRMTRADPRHVFVPFNIWNELNKTATSKIQIVDVKASGEATLMFQSLVINGPKGPLSVIGDSDIPAGEMLVTQIDTWELIYKGKGAPYMQNLDGNSILRTASADAIEARWKANYQLINRAPAFSARVLLK